MVKLLLLNILKKRIIKQKGDTRLLVSPFILSFYVPNKCLILLFPVVVIVVVPAIIPTLLIVVEISVGLLIVEAPVHVVASPLTRLEAVQSFHLETLQSNADCKNLFLKP